MLAKDYNIQSLQKWFKGSTKIDANIFSSWSWLLSLSWGLFSEFNKSVVDEAFKLLHVAFGILPEKFSLVKREEGLESLK